MKIIQLGNINVQLACPKCNTIIEIEIHELTKEDDKYSIKCPLCDNQIIINNDMEVCKIANKRIELLSDMSKFTS